MSASLPDARILVIDDEVQIRRLLRVTLEGTGYRVSEAETGASGLTEAAALRPELVVLDLGLPDMPGLEVLRRLREWSQVPVLILSVRNEEPDKVAALDAGADDYLTKPFAGGELLARVRVMLRRRRSDEETKSVSFGSIAVDLVARAVHKNGLPVKLTVKEYAILRLLVVNRGRVLTHRQILREVWGPKSEEQTHYLRVYMARLRQKLEEDPAHAQHLLTESGIGYRLRE